MKFNILHCAVCVLIYVHVSVQHELAGCTHSFTEFPLVSILAENLLLGMFEDDALHAVSVYRHINNSASSANYHIFDTFAEILAVRLLELWK